MDKPGFILKWRGKGFGERLMVALLSCILTDNGINTVFGHRYKILVDCPIHDLDNKMHRTYKRIFCEYETTEEPIILQRIKYFEELTKRKIEVTKNHIPVKFYDIPSIPSVDVVMCTRSGAYSPYRNWPYFDELKKLLNKEKISFVDLNAEEIFNIECLNYVKKSKLYLGLETGTSHYVSQFANGKALILQGGFSIFDFWAYPYDYEYLQINNIHCRPCFINRGNIKEGQGCKYDNMCMKEIKANQVFTRIIQKLLRGV